MKVTQKNGKYVLCGNGIEFETLQEEIASNFKEEGDMEGSELYVILQVFDEIIEKNGQSAIKITIEGL